MTTDDVFDDESRSDEPHGDGAPSDGAPSDGPQSDDPAQGLSEDLALRGDASPGGGSPDRGLASDKPPSPAAAAANWRTVVAADVGMGMAAVVVGVVLAFVWQPVVGAGIASLALVYVVLAVRRGAQWADWRRRNGL
jgi:hypothetical protein